MSNGEVLNQHNLARKVAAASLAGIAALTAMEGVADAGILHREALIYEEIHENPQTVPNARLVFDAGTKIFSAPFADARVAQKVPEGTHLYVNDGLRFTDPSTGRRYIGFTFGKTSDNESYADLARDELWVRRSAATDIIRNDGPKQVELRVTKYGKVWSPDAKYVNNGNMLVDNTSKVTR